MQAIALLPMDFTIFVAFFHLRVRNEDILDVMFGWRTLFSANK
jgi:hypothetical protein